MKKKHVKTIYVDSPGELKEQIYNALDLGFAIDIVQIAPPSDFVSIREVGTVKDSGTFELKLYVWESGK